MSLYDIIKLLHVYDTKSILLTTLIIIIILRSVVDVCGGVRWYPPLLPGRVDPLLASNDMELQLRTLTEQHREVQWNLSA